MIFNHIFMKFKYFSIAALLVLSPMALAQESTEMSPIAEATMTSSKNKTMSQKTDPRSLYHFNRRNDGKGYTRFYGRRVGNSGSASAYQNNRSKNPMVKTVNSASEMPVRTTTKLEVKDEAYSPVRFYHRNSYNQNYGRFGHYQRLDTRTNQ